MLIKEYRSEWVRNIVQLLQFKNDNHDFHDNNDLVDNAANAVAFAAVVVVVAGAVVACTCLFHCYRDVAVSVDFPRMSGPVTRSLRAVRESGPRVFRGFMVEGLRVWVFRDLGLPAEGRLACRSKDF